MDRPAVDAFHIAGDSAPMPPAARVLYADGAAAASTATGAAGEGFRPGTDLELSHWVPTTTPERWQADSSTEICLRFCADPPDEQFDLAVNNHVDVDGILSLFALVRSPLALAHREVVVAAAEMGDFNAAADREAFRLSQELTLQIVAGRAAGWDMETLYRAGFEVAEGVLLGTHDEPPEVAAAWDVVQHGHERIASGEVAVAEVAERLVSFILPPLEGDDLVAALAVPAFTSVLDTSTWLWPQVRNRDHGQQTHLVSVPGPAGWFHDLWLPGYCWAHTPDRWTPPGLVSTGSSNVWAFGNPALSDAVQALRSRERNPGEWVLAEQLTPFDSLAGRAFPIVVSFVDGDGAPAPSGLPPDLVATVLASAF